MNDAKNKLVLYMLQETLGDLRNQSSKQYLELLSHYDIDDDDVTTFFATVLK